MTTFFFSGAERAGFEPAIHFRRIHAFQACLFNHSSTSPKNEAPSQNGVQITKKYSFPLHSVGKITEFIDYILLLSRFIFISHLFSIFNPFSQCNTGLIFYSFNAKSALALRRVIAATCFGFIVQTSESLCRIKGGTMIHFSSPCREPEKDKARPFLLSA